ncbi:MAG: GNAT family N-acetyltransferase [Chloroflexota bacterium]
MNQAHPIQLKSPAISKLAEEEIDELLVLLNEYARRGDLLPRTRVSIEMTLKDWVISKVDGRIVGCGSLLMYGPNLAEVRSLAVSDEAQGLGLGRLIVAQLIDEARERGIPKLFALTRVVGFFERMGFSVTEKENFPEKVWTDCSICPLKENCDEIAVEMVLK